MDSAHVSLTIKLFRNYTFPPDHELTLVVVRVRGDGDVSGCVGTGTCVVVDNDGVEGDEGAVGACCGAGHCGCNNGSRRMVYLPKVINDDYLMQFTREK